MSDGTNAPLVAVALDASAVLRLARSSAFPPEWFSQLYISSTSDGLVTIRSGGVAYILNASAIADSPVLVIRANNATLLSELPSSCRPEAFDRILRACLAQIESGISIPLHWRPFHDGSRLSFQSNGRNTGCRSRLLLDSHPKGTRNFFVQVIDESVRDLSKADLDWESFDTATANLEQAIEQIPATLAANQSARPGQQIDLDDTLSSEITHGSSLTEWYDSKLTAQQRRFVDFPLDRPVRLRGAAGTGKTLALAVKFLRAIYSAADANESRSFVFLTHSISTVDVVQHMLMTLDERGILYSPSSPVDWEVRTLQELANDAMSYDLSDLQPLSNDGLEGRRLQLEAIKAVINDYLKSDWPLVRSQCSERFQLLMEAEPNSVHRKHLCWELMNEFACVLDADGVRESIQKRKKYLSMTRRKWMMPLVKKEEKEVVLDLYDRFRSFLREMDAIGVDQMIADYLGYLDSFRWDSIRRRDGFDAVFVDELHLFNRQERMVFQFLTKESKRTPVVLMAYDAKQSPRDTFVQTEFDETTQASLWTDTGLGTVEKIELKEVFRYTPEIAEFLASIDSTFPGVDFDEEWPAYDGVTQTSAGPKPMCCEVKDLVSIYNLTFEKAHRWARRLGAGKKVAVLTISEELFDRYLAAGQHKKEYIPVTSREELVDIRYAGKRFIFSRPEYVAGLQFEVVILIDVNRDEVSDSESALGAKRRFVSEVYLGASRAERVLEVYAQSARGGLTDILDGALNFNVIHKLSAEQARRHFPE